MTSEVAGRPTKYNEELSIKILGQLAEGKSLVDICKKKGMPSQSAVYRWAIQYPEFRERYTRAREIQAHVFFDEIVSIADNTELGNDRLAHLRIEARKWVVGRMRPIQYGEAVLRKQKVARDEEAEYIREMKNITPDKDEGREIRRDPKQIMRMLNYIVHNKVPQLEAEQEKNDDDTTDGTGDA